MKIARIVFDGKCYNGLVTELGFQPYEGSFYDGSAKVNGNLIPLDEIRYLPPCEPKTILAVGKNYKDHAAEMGGAFPANPILFIKPTSAIIAHKEHIGTPKGCGRIDYEGELAFVVKKTAKHVKKEEAASYILGYTCMFDITAREVQSTDGQWTRAKSFDTFAPFGPVIETNLNVMSSSVTTRKNGNVVQQASFTLMTWPPAALLEFITSCMTLYPGDVVTTGTPAGIGPITQGDTLELDIPGIGILMNKVI